MRSAKLALILAVTAAVVTACANRPPSDQGKLTVLASIFPLADIVREVGGDQVSVQALLPAGMSPHLFTPRPSDAEALLRSRLLVVVGMGIDQWANQAAARARAADITVLTITDSTEFRRALDELKPLPPEEAESSSHAGHSHEAGDPHVWLDPVFMRLFTYEVRDTLVRMDPSHGEEYRVRADRFAVALQQLDDEYRTQLARVGKREFVTFHEAFSYICRRYNLREYALEDPDAQGFGPQQRQDLLNAIHKHDIRAILAEPQFDAQRLESLASGTGASVGRIDPLGNPSIKGYDSYLSMMRSNLAVLVEALKE